LPAKHFYPHNAKTVSTMPQDDKKGPDIVILDISLGDLTVSKLKDS
jgi:hypothetical protein